jgi:transposase InsO family protein
MADHMRTELVLDALGMAVAARRGGPGLVAHSDHGSQYTSLVYGTYAKTSGIELSMGRIGDPWDNAVAETFFASLEKELLRRERFPTRESARMRLFWYIECFYNPRRRHSGLGYLSPVEYEERHRDGSGPFGPADPVQPALEGALAGVGAPTTTITISSDQVSTRTG